MDETSTSSNAAHNPAENAVSDGQIPAPAVATPAITPAPVETPLGSPNEQARVATTGNFDHEASTSRADAVPQDASLLTSPASTSTQGAPASPLERTLSELAFSRFRNSMRAEARRESARKSLLGRLGALPTDDTPLSVLQQPPSLILQQPSPVVLQQPSPVVLQQPSPLVFQQPSPLVLQQQPHLPPPFLPPSVSPSFQGQEGDSQPTPSVISSDVLTSEPTSDGLPPSPPVDQTTSAYERFARAEFQEHVFGIGRFVWKRVPVDELIRHSRVLLRSPLLRSLADGPLSIKATTVFAHLKGYMEDPALPVAVTQTGQPSDVKLLDTLRIMKISVKQTVLPIWQKLQPARQILLFGIKYEALRDEIFCQVCKQTTFNPMRVSDARGWQALAVFTGTFPPSEKLRPVLEEHLKQVADGLLVGTAPDPEKAKTMASYCLERLRKICRVGARHVVPSGDEILATEHMHRTPISISVPGGLAQVVLLDSMTTGGEVTAEIAGKLGLPDVGFYGVFVVVNGVEKFAGTHGFLLEAYTEWNVAPLPVLQEESQMFRKTRQYLMGQCAECLYNIDPDTILAKDIKHGITVMEKLKEKKQEATVEKSAKADDAIDEPDPVLRNLFADIHLLFKKNWFPLEEAPDFTRIRAFEYAQATHDVVHGLYVLDEPDALMLAALQLRAEHGSSADLEEYLTVENVQNYGPKEYVTGYEKAWRNAVLKKVTNLPWEVDVNVCQNDYVAFLKTRCPLYGSAWFYVVPKACPHLPREVYFVLNLSGVYFVDVPMKEQLMHLRYVELCSWGHSDTTFSLVTGNMSYNVEFRLATSNGKEIVKILQYFIRNVQL